MKLKIVHKGLAIILIPLALQIVCFIWLFVQVGNAENVAAREANLVRGFEVLNDIVAEFNDSVANYMSMLSRRRPQTDLAVHRKRVYALISEYRVILSQMPELNLSGQEIEAAARDHFLLLKQIEDKYDEAAEHGAIEAVEKYAAIEAQFNREARHIHRLRRLLKQQESELLSAQQAGEAARSSFKTQILIAVSLSIVLTLVVVILFLQNISERLTVLVCNAELIPKNKPLTQTVSGTDELAYLDQVLHRTSSDLHKAADYRKSLMQMVAHDIRSPLMSVKLITNDLMIASKGISDKISGRLGELQTRCDQVVQFVEDLLTIDKLEAGKLNLNYDQCDLEELAKDSLLRFAPIAADKQVSVALEVPSTKILGDKNRILQVLNNLLSNAIKYSPNGGKVKLRSEVDGSRVKVSISDEGPGVPPDQQSKIFEKFQQTEEGDQVQGFGLGLAICKLIISEHGGTIGVTSEQGKGSTFWFALPVDASDDV